MKNNMLKTLIKEEIKNILNEGPKWKSDNLKDEFYNLWASADLFANNLSRYMDDMNKGKTKDAIFSLKVAFDESRNLSTYMRTQLPNVKKELQEKNKL